jgi:peptide/nickel transport system permease protein
MTTQPYPPAAGSAPASRRRPTAAAWGRALLRSPASSASLLWLVAVVLVSVFASGLAPYSPLQQNLNALSQGPSLHHLLGTDELGRDVLSRLMFGGATLLWGAAEATVIAFALGVPAGLLAGYSGGMLDRLLSWLADLSFALPAFIIVIALAVIYPQNVVVLMGALGVISAGGVLRFTRNLTRAVRNDLYVDAARVSGLRPRQILIRHILPVIAPPLVVQACLGMSVGLIVLASLSFLGLGTNPQTPNWGQMIYDASQQITTDPWLMVPGGAALVLTVMALNVVGSSVRDLAPGTKPGRRARRPRPRPRGVRQRLRPARPAAGPRPAAVPRPAARPPAGPLLQVAGLTVAFPGPAGQLEAVVDQVSFGVRAGETLGLVGESGCGKTVSVLAVPGLVPRPGTVSAGSICFDGTELAGASERFLSGVRGSRIGYISQDPMAALDPSFTIGSQLREVIRRHARCSRAEGRARCLRALREAGIADPAVTARLYPHQVSGGMAQRAAIAMALSGEPALLIADEPTTALDVTVQAEILDLLRELTDRRGMALILVTHDLGVVAEACDRVVVMYAGQVVEHGRTQEVLESPRHPYTIGLLNSMPDGPGAARRLAAIPGAVPAPRDWPSWCRFEPRCALAAEACRSGPVKLAAAGPGRLSRCVRAAELAGVTSR